MTLSFLLLFAGIVGSWAQPAVLTFDDCFADSSTDQKLNISTVYAQLTEVPHGAFLNFTILGQTPEVILESSNGSNPVASEWSVPPDDEVLTVLQPPYSRRLPCSHSMCGTITHTSVKHYSHPRHFPHQTMTRVDIARSTLAHSLCPAR